MATATTSTVSKKLFTLVMGVKEAQALRNLLARVKKGQKGATIANLHSIRKALTAQGVNKCRATVLRGAITSTDA